MYNYKGPKTQESIQQHTTNINFQHHISMTILAGPRGKKTVMDSVDESKTYQCLVIVAVLFLGDLFMQK